MAVDSLSVPASMTKVLETAKGRRYLEDIIQKYTRCATTVQKSSVLCASVQEEDLKAFKKDFETNIMSKTCKVRTYKSPLVVSHPYSFVVCFFIPEYFWKHFTEVCMELYLNATHMFVF